MIRHIVLLRFKDSVSPELKATLFRDLDALKGHLSGVEASCFGPNISVEDTLIHGFHDGFWFDFTDEAARQAYLVDEAHQAVGARIVANTIDGPAGVIVFDIRI